MQKLLTMHDQAPCLTLVAKEKLISELDHHSRPENLDILKINEIRKEIIQPQTRSKELKTQKSKVVF